MSCNHCGTKFSFFHKENGCSNCNLSFCSKCLKQKCKLPNKGTGEYHVCNKCYQAISNNAGPTKEPPPPPPDAFLRRLEALENPVAPPITIYKPDEKTQCLRTGLSPVDAQLLERLEKLKEEKEKAPPLSDDEIRRRLNVLKGVSDFVEGPSKMVFTADTRSDQEKVNFLLGQYSAQKDIEMKNHPEMFEESYMDDSEDEVEKITKKIREEVALDEKTTQLLPVKDELAKGALACSGEKDDSSPELPWCVLCNKDAKYQCLDCDDLYCAECHMEVHKTWGDTDHRVIEYNQKM